MDPYSLPLLLLPLLLTVFPALCSGDLAQDKQECGPQLIGLSPCIAYVQTGSTARAPTADCCSGVKQVLVSSMKCVCLFAKYKDDKSLGLDVNITSVLGLPGACHATANISLCTGLLHLAPNSSLAKLFDDFAKQLNGSTGGATAPGSPTIVSTTSSGNSSSSGETPTPKNNGGGKGRRCLEARQMAYGLALNLLVYYYSRDGLWNPSYV